ncbi:MAG: acyl-CoA desaturase [Planctomycetes bacterium]|nr:acyl-CoA desaturase [Planctomycetota bacterium]
MTELKLRVDGYFATTGKSPNDCWQMYLKTAIILTWYAGSYIALVFYAQGALQAIPLAMSLGVAMAAIGFCIQHDGGHDAYSKKRWVNRLAAYTLDLIGASSYLWHWKHAIFHHTFTNVQGYDSDIDLGRFARFSPHAKKYRFQRWQHLYLWPLYGISSSRWHLMGDYEDFYRQTVGPHHVPRPRGWELFWFFAGKVPSYTLAFVIPMFFHPWYIVLAFYMLVTCTIGVTLSVVFQLAHCVEEAEFPLPEDGTLRMENAWAVHQVETTVDFGRNSFTLCWLLGGLNFQIEHHLFPRICHIHYPALSKIVEQTCKEYGVRYACHTSFWSGIKSHYRWLKRMGREEMAVAK